MIPSLSAQGTVNTAPGSSSLTITPTLSEKAQAATITAYINYGSWNSAAATGRNDKPVAVQVSLTPGGPGATKAYTRDSWVKVSDVHTGVPTEIAGEVWCPHPNWLLRRMGVTVYVTPLPAVRYSWNNGQSMWL
jgi:hypothetical protein